MDNTFTPVETTKNKRILRPLLLAALFLSFSLFGVAQTNGITFSLLHQPCNNDGILVVYDSLGIPPVTFQYYVAGQQFSHVSNSVYDTLFNYSGATVSVNAASNGGLNYAYGYYAGSPPFTFTDTTTAAVCPIPGTARITVTGGTAPFSYQ